MTIELYYLALVTVLTALLFVPYVLNRIAVRGIADTVGYPDNPKPQAPWAVRLQKAHGNAVENLVVFATLVLIAEVAGVTGDGTAFAAQLYFWARAVHAIAYTLAWPWIRTLAFGAGLAAQAVFALRLLG
jgi:uncharacterized MAPEG superfamily protein